MVVAAALLLSVQASEITFSGGGGFQLKGEFAVPDQAKRAAGVLLLPGSGPTDRNGNQPGLNINLLKDLSAALNGWGKVTFRFDKRAVNSPFNMRQWPKTMEGMADTFAFDQFTADAAAAYRRLRFHPAVNPSRVFILGHSEGGIIALALAARLQPKGLILLGTPGRDLGTVLIEQVDASIDRSTLAANVKATIKAQNRAVVASYKAGKPWTEPLHPALQPLYNPSVRTYMLQVMRVQPDQLAKGFAGPVFIANGEKDIQVRITADFQRLIEARKGLPTTGVAIPDGSHNFKKVQDPMRELGFAGPVAPELIDALKTWPGWR